MRPEPRSSPSLDRAAVRADLVRRVHARRGDDRPVSDDASLQVLGLDSADVLELVADLEDAWHITVPLDELVSVRTFGQMVDRIHARVLR